MSKEVILKPWYKKWWVIILFIFLIIIWLTNNDNSINYQNTTLQQQNKIIESTSNKILPVVYKIIKTEDQSHKVLGNKLFSDYTTQELNELPIDKKMLYRVVVSNKIKKNQVRPTIEKIISDVTQKDNDIDEITLFLYSDKNLVSGPYDIWTATWAPKWKLWNITSEIAESNDRSDYKITIQIKKNLEKYLKQRGKSENKFWLTEKKRRQFFKEIVAAEDRAHREAEKLYPTNITNPNYKQENLMKNINLADKLMKKYRAKVRGKYNLTKEQSIKIKMEAFKEEWPLK